ncbi:MAG TPA: HDOD domain-containing protein [Bacteroidota bacterium]|nr:HDOD domain-containing protein [Bacteroidota bacterium]
MPPKNIREDIQKVKDLVSFPVATTDILAAIDDENISIEKVARLIELDVILTTKLLRAINSSFYGLRSRVSTVQNAVSLLGVAEVGRLMITFLLANKMSSPKLINREAFARFWRHSVTTASIARLIATKYYFRTAGKEFVGGLLHDFGKLVLMEISPDDYSAVEGLIKDKLYMDTIAEEECFGINHCEAGGLLAERWRLPVNLAEIIRYHHTPKFAPMDQTLVAIVRTADLFSQLWGYGIEGDPVNLNIETDEAWQLLVSEHTALRTISFAEFSEKLKKSFDENLEFVRMMNANV